MTATATHAPAPAPGPARSGVWSWITTTDHKRIGILYGVTAFFFFLIGGLEALFIRLQLARPENHLVSAETFNQLFTMHGTTMIFLAVMPLSAMFFNYIIPLQIGARDVAFPRLNAFSYWVFMLGRQVLGIASLAAGFNFLTTIINMRAPGMRMMRLPVFTWMSLITQIIVVTAFPVITVGLVFLMLDRFFGTTFYSVAAGGSLLLWQHLFWLFGHPEVYILILPAMGILSEVLPTFSRKPLFGYPSIVYATALIGFLGFGV